MDPIPDPLHGPAASGAPARLTHRSPAPLRWIAAALGVVCLLAAAAGFARGAAPDATSYRVSVVQTSANLSQRLTPLPGLHFTTRKVSHEPVIKVDARVRYQAVQGFGAAMTDSSAWLMERKISPAARQTLMSELFGPTGIRLDFVKVPVAASDFTHTGRPYTYDDLSGGASDPRLSRFSTAHDEAYVLPALQQARAVDPGTEFLATPWSPPAWMKANRSLSNAGNAGRLLPADAQAYADYLVKFIQAYARAGIPIRALTLTNEPAVATLYPGLDISPGQESTWARTDLIPALARARLHPRIYGNVRGWGPTTTYAAAAVRGSAARELAGLAWHCYFGSPTVMSQYHRLDPRMEQIVDECSPGLSPTPMSEVVISSLRNWAGSVSLWNLVLDPTGGPAQLPNHGCKGCSGLATINPATGAVTINPAYYALGQASAFIDPGARRIASGNFVAYRYPRSGVNVVSPGLDDVAVRNPDGSLVLMAYNNSPAAIRFAVSWKGRAFSYTLPAGATATFVWNRK